MNNRVNVSNFKPVKIKTEDESKGIMTKRWARDDDNVIVLIKYEEETSPNQDLMELMISELLNLIKVPCANIRLGFEQLEDGTVLKCSIVDSFMDYSQGDEIYNVKAAYRKKIKTYVPATVSDEINTVFSIFNEIPDISKKEYLESCQLFIETLLCDFIFDIPDRHLDNFSVVTRQSDGSVRYEKLFDHGLAFFGYSSIKERRIAEGSYSEKEIIETLDAYCIQLEDLINRINANLTHFNLFNIIYKEVYNDLGKDFQQHIFRTILNHIDVMNEKISKNKQLLEEIDGNRKV